VYDYIFKGMSQPLIGNFVVNIGELQHHHDDIIIAEDKKTLDIINEILLKIQDADEQKIEMEEKRLEAEREKEQEETMKKNLLNKLRYNQRTALAKQTNNNLFGKLVHKTNQSKKYKKVNDDDELEDLESGVGAIEMTKKKVDSSQLLDSEEIKEEETLEDNPMEVMMKQGDENEEEIGHEKEEARAMMNKFVDKKQTMKDNRTFRMSKMFKQMKLVGKNVVYPTYQYDDRLKIHRESIPPPKEVFLPIGYDPQYDSKQKHFRRCYEDELENIKEVMPKSPFQTFDIIKGQSRGLSKGWFTTNNEDEAGQVSTIKNVGKFKGIVSVINKERDDIFSKVKKSRIQILKDSLNNLSLALYDEEFKFNYDELISAEGKELFCAKLQQLGCERLEIEKHFTQMNYKEELARLMMTKTNCLVRVYLLDVDELPPKDVGGSVDPYLILKLNDEIINERKNYVKNSHNPEFNKMFEFQSEFPGCSQLRIQLWDHDKVFGDDFIGETLVDIEDRFFSPEWQSIKNKPVETRQLYHKSTKVSQGVVKCWIEIISNDLVSKSLKWNITPRPPTHFQVRLVVWETKDVKVKDWEGTSDIYCRAYFDSVTKNKRTDTHYRSMDGKGSFNYRLLFDIEHPSKDHIMNLQIWDADAFSKNDFIGDSSLNLILPIEDATMTNKPVHLNKKYYQTFLQDYMGGGELEFYDDESFWLNMKDKDGQVNGKMRVQMSIMPKDQSDAYQVGEARTDPNHSPFLPPPIGRIVWSLNPWTMLNQCIAPAIRNKIICAICCILCLVIFIMCLPNIMGQVFVDLIIAIF
jgi:hypothetical protein